jgi:hypothetical protein
LKVLCENYKIIKSSLIVLPNANLVFLKSSLNVVIAVKKHIFALGSCSLI